MMNVTARYGSSRGSGWPLPVGLLTIVSGLFTGMSVVTLTGVVASNDERKRAVQLARDTDGIKRVVDKLEVSKQ